MADRGKKVSALDSWANSVSGNDSILVYTRSQPIPDTYSANVSDFFDNLNSDVVLANNKTFSANTIVVRGPISTPANSTAATVPAGGLYWDSNYFYVAVGNNTLKRVAISSF